MGRNLDISYCRNLKRLPNVLHVPGFLDLNGCESLKKLPDQLSVSGMGLQGCEGLKFYRVGSGDDEFESYRVKVNGGVYIVRGGEMLAEAG